MNIFSAKVMLELVAMRGDINLVLDKLVRVSQRINNLEIISDKLKSATQSLKEGAESAADTAKALALGLKDAQELEAQKKAEALLQKDATWSPYQKLLSVAVGLAAIITVIVLLVPKTE